MIHMYYQVFEKEVPPNVLGSGVNIAIFKSSLWRSAIVGSPGQCKGAHQTVRC